MTSSVSKADLRQRVENLECRHEVNPDVALLILPDGSFPDKDLPDVSTDGIRVVSEDTGQSEVIVPHHRPDQWWHGGVPLVAESHVAAVWRNMSQQQLAREHELREEHDEPIPPILEELEE